uniref:Uncharacterized protein n=1 Tax=Anguilla anguilla TaxID=7936 RepID=A0A0E9W810_ANGAN
MTQMRSRMYRTHLLEHFPST